MKIKSKNQNKNNQNKSTKLHSLLFYFLISCAVIIMGIFIMSQKEGLDFDEIGTFGLSNNRFQLDVEDFKEYSGNELLLKYAAVQNGEEFNVGNVFFNQKMDTHPPLYYLLVNFICSIRKGTFSMWYGLIINLFFMLILFWEMRYLFNLVIEDELVSTIASFIAFLTYGFVNEIVFIRMYVMLSAISMAFVILAIKIIKSYSTNSSLTENNAIVGAKHCEPSVVWLSYTSPLIFFLLCLLGILTQYHFILIAFYFSLVLGIFLISKKDFKSLLLIVLAGVLSIGLAILIFPGMINHIFGGAASLHALNGTQIESLGTRFLELAVTIRRSFLGIGFVPYLIILSIAILFAFVTIFKKKINFKNVIIDNKWYFIILFSCIFYFVSVSFTVKYTFARYLYNIYPLLAVCIISTIYLLYKSINIYLRYIGIAVIIMLAITSRFKGFPFTKENEDIPFSLNAGNNTYEEFLKANKETKILGIYSRVDKRGRSDTQGTSLWKIQRPLYSFRYMDKVSFVDLNENQDILYEKNDNIASNDALFIVIYIDDDDDNILSGIMRNNGFSNVERILFNTYYHMYRITK